jgi:small subunit ribosomal protein S18
MSEEQQQEAQAKIEEPIKEEPAKEEAPVQETPEAPAAPAAPAPSEAPRTDSRPPAGGDHMRRPRHEYGDSRERGERFPRFKKKGCRFCRDSEPIDYKKTDLLGRFITDGGKILPRRVTGTCAKHQRLVARAIKRARTLALLPFIEK